MPKTPPHERRLTRLAALQERIRETLAASLAQQELARTSRVARDDDGDTIFGIDIDAEAVVMSECERWARDEAFVLIAEGIEPATGRAFGRSGASGPAFRMILDPIDGTRGLMFDKRSAWSLGAIAPDRGADTRLIDIEVAVMTELPTSRQGRVDQLWAVQGQNAHGRRTSLLDGSTRELAIRPSRATDLRHGFATVCNFFQGGKELTARLDEDIVGAALGGWNHKKAEVYTDQYISSGGQLAELALGRDRFVLDVRPLIHRALGYTDSLCSRPYDLCTALVAQAAGCVVTAPDGAMLDAPLDVTTNVAWVGYANAELAERLGPVVREALARHRLLA